MKKNHKLSLVREKVQACVKCSELVEYRTQTVFGVGNPNTKIVLLGEAPGKDEDLQGEPFVGKSGQLLTNILSSLGLSRDDVYILNILKCRPPQNRTPTKEESNNCRKFLDLQLRVIDPKFIVCLGTTAAQNLLDTDEKITNLRGKTFDYLTYKVICTFHPSYGLRVNNAKYEIYKDLMVVVNSV